MNPDDDMKKFLTMLLLMPLAVLAGEPVLEDFARGLEINTDGSAAIYRLPLPVEVYQTVTRPDLGDIRVYNAERQPVPFAIRHADERRSTRTAWTRLPLFPLPAEAPGTAPPGSGLDITVRDDGTIVEIKSGGVTAEAQQDAQSYLIDLSKLQQQADVLEFSIASSERNYLMRARLEASDDLNYWSPVVHDATLSSLQYAGHLLVKNRIPVPAIKSKYLRLTWQDEIRQLRITGVRAVFTTVTSGRAGTWSTVTGVRGEEKGKVTYNFDTGGVFPIEQVNILLPEDNTLIEGKLSSRSSDKEQWRPHETGLFYHLTVKGTYLERGPVSVGLTTNRYWRLEVKSEDGLGSQPLQLSFAWAPNDIYLLGRGPGPYILAYGNAAAVAPGKPVDALMHALSDNQASEIIGFATPGKAIELKGQAALIPGLEINWRELMLWSILLTGVVLIAIIAWRLYQQMSRTM